MNDLRNFLNTAKAIQADMEHLGVSKPSGPAPQAQEPLWDDERIAQRYDALGGELFDGNARPLQHYREVCRALAFEICNEYDARIAELEAELARAKPDHDHMQMLRKIRDNE